VTRATAEVSLYRSLLVAHFVALLWFALDQALKGYAVHSVPRYPQRLTPIAGLIELAYAENRGAAWSLFSNATLPLTVFRIVASIALLWWLARQPAPNLGRAVAVGLIVGGALGNAFDGATRGYVVDMLLSPTLTALYRPIFGTEYPVFNLADVGVVSGLALLLWTSRKPARTAGAP
jgi:signal peptidase II